MSDRLRPLWDFDDLDATESRLRVQLEGESDDAGRAEVLTQLARVEGLRDDFDGCERLLKEAEALAGASAVAKVRIDLERGRKLRSSGDPEGALPLQRSRVRLSQASNTSPETLRTCARSRLVTIARRWRSGRNAASI